MKSVIRAGLASQSQRDRDSGGRERQRKRERENRERRRDGVIGGTTSVKIKKEDRVENELKKDFPLSVFPP